jgi:hypothetical protein
VVEYPDPYPIRSSKIVKIEELGDQVDDPGSAPPAQVD